MPNENRAKETAEWVYSRLRGGGVVSKEEFLARFKSEKQTVSSVSSDWHRTIHAIGAVLPLEEVATEDKGATFRLSGKEHKNQDSPLDRFASPKFQPRREATKKAKIGELIASFLSEDLLSEKTIFLGSGTTVFHVGLKMCETRRTYDQRFVTVNIPLAALWCAQQPPPVSHISIPEAELNTETFRFANTVFPRWPLTVSIVGADGCVYDDASSKVLFFGNEVLVAKNTSRFVRKTMHSVMFCLTSDKVQLGFARAPNTGPLISPPNPGVIRILVTDEISDVAKAAIENDGWLIVTESKHWDQVRLKIKEGQRQERRPRVSSAGQRS